MPSAFSPTVLTLPSTGGTGQGELNLVLNSVGASDATGWVGATRQSGGGPLNPTVSTYFTLSAANSASENSTSGSYYSFTLPSGLQNRKLKVEFYYTSVATDVVKVSVYKGTTRVPLSTDSSGSTTLPASTTGKFTAYFDTDSSGSWSVNVTRTSGSGTALSFTQVVVGPGIQPQGAVVGEWQSYTPTGTLTTNVTYSGRYRRVGTNAEVRVSLAFSGTNTQGEANFSPAQLLNGLGLTLNTTDVISTTNASCGTWSMLDSGLNPRYSGIVTLSSGSFMLMYPTGSGTASQVNTSVGNPIVIAAGDNIQLSVNIPIAEWAGSGTVQLAQNDVEYAARTASADVYGPAGTPVEAFAPTGNTAVIRTVTFQTPIQTGDAVVLEFASTSIASGTVWVPASQMFGFTTQQNDAGTTSYGVSVVQSGTKTVDVKFYSQASKTSGDTWSTYTSAWKWRVRKSSAGAAVGFGLYQPGVSAGLVSSSGLVGRTDGLAVPSGYVGEILPSTLTTTSVAVSASNLTATALRRITAATAGTYLIQASITPPGVTGSLNRLRLYTTPSAGTVYGVANDSWITTSGVTGTNAACGVWFAPAGATLDLTVDTLSGTLSGGPYTVASTFTAVRIA